MTWNLPPAIFRIKQENVLSGRQMPMQPIHCSVKCIWQRATRAKRKRPWSKSIRNSHWFLTPIYGIQVRRTERNLFSRYNIKVERQILTAHIGLCFLLSKTRFLQHGGQAWTKLRKIYGTPMNRKISAGIFLSRMAISLQPMNLST